MINKKTEHNEVYYSKKYSHDLYHYNRNRSFI